MMPKPHFSNCQNISCNVPLSEYEFEKQKGGKGCHYHRFCKLCRRRCKYGGTTIIWNCLRCKKRMSIIGHSVSKIYCPPCREVRTKEYGRWYYDNKRYHPHPILRHKIRLDILRYILKKDNDVCAKELEIKVERQYDDIYHHLKIMKRDGYLTRTKWRAYEMTPLAIAELKIYEASNGV